MLNSEEAESTRQWSHVSKLIPVTGQELWLSNTTQQVTVWSPVNNGNEMEWEEKYASTEYTFQTWILSHLDLLILWLLWFNKGFLWQVFASFTNYSQTGLTDSFQTFPPKKAESVSRAFLSVLSPHGFSELQETIEAGEEDEWGHAVGRRFISDINRSYGPETKSSVSVLQPACVIKTYFTTLSQPFYRCVPTFISRLTLHPIYIL